MRDDFYRNLDGELEDLRKNGTYKELRHLTAAMAGRSNIEEYGDVIMLCSNNYLGLSDNKRLIAAGADALEKYGSGASSVRFICGTYDIHKRLERQVADFLGMEAALTYTSCWAANTAAIPALLSPGDTVLSDELNHASIIDGCRLVRKGVNKDVYKHSSMESLEEKLIAAKGGGTTLIVTDGVFSMEGDVAKLPQIVGLADKYSALVMVDDSHATGVIGKTGRGTMEYYGMKTGVDIISGTFGKALGGAGGGFIAATEAICDILVQRSRPHLFSNSLPPVLCAIAYEAIACLKENPGIVESLMKKTAYMRERITSLGFDPIKGDSAIIPIIIGETADAIKASRLMMEKGVFAIGFGFPVVPEGAARIRVQVSDALTYEDIDIASSVIADAINSVRRKAGG